MIKNAIHFITIISCLCFPVILSARQKKSGIWQITPVVADGNTTDWPVAYPWYSEKGGLAYIVTNDAKHLYFSVKCGKSVPILRMLQAGFSIYIDTSGKKKMLTAIHFLPVPKDSATVTTNEQWANEFKDVKLEGFKDCNGMLSVKQENDCGIKMALGLDEYHQLVWEIILPFEIFYKNEIAATDLDKKMSIGIVLNETVINETDLPHGPMYGMPMEPPPGGDGDFGGQIGGDGAPPPIGGSMEVKLKAVRIWQPFTIAFKK